MWNSRRAWSGLAIAFGLIVLGGWQFVFSGGAGGQEPNANGGNPPAGKGIDPLPIQQVVLFNSGVGYLQREGDVTGNARIDLSFPFSDINDLLKSLVLQDSEGKIGTVNYDSFDPIEKTLRSFALDLNNNPTFAQILNQARGEHVEITRTTEKGQTEKMQGTIVGVESKIRPIGKDQAAPHDILNLHGKQGMQSVELDRVLNVKFLNPTLEREFQQALRVLASSHDTMKKAVSIGFQGGGKRKVRVGYVLERPIWKTSYRLRMEPNGKVFLQGWALVENTSDDDWNDVRMVLVSGKPISFKMNLYESLYIPRPEVEPELFASLRPPVYGGAMNEGGLPAGVVGGAPPAPGAELADQARLGQLGNRGVNPAQKQFVNPYAGNFGGGFGGGFGANMMGGNMLGGGGGNYANPQNANFDARNSPMNFQQQAQNRLSYEELQKRRADSQKVKDDAKKAGSSIAGFNFQEGIQSVATAEEVGDYFQYVIDQKISLPRQKSAMLPILDQTIDGQKVSIFNESVHAKYPLLGLRLKNTSGQPLTQGPITVYESGTYAGDTRVLDLQPNEERLLSYALDQGTEIKSTTKDTVSPQMRFRIDSPQMTARYQIQQTRTYTIRNRSPHDRVVILEHPIRSEWKLIEPAKPNEKTRDLYRFQVTVASGKTETFNVVEEQSRVDSHAFQGGQAAYSVAAGVNVKVVTQNHGDKLVGLKIEKGMVKVKNKSRETRSYFVQNHSDIAREFTVDHVVRPDWVRIDDQGETQRGPAVHSFVLKADKSKVGQKDLNEERVFDVPGTYLKLVPEATVRDWLASAVPSGEVKSALTQFVAKQAKLADSIKELGETEKGLKVLSDDQSRLRENLKIIPPTSDHHKKFLEKFVNQETEIETMQKQIRTLMTSVTSQTRELDAFVAKLTVE